MFQLFSTKEKEMISLDNQIEQFASYLTSEVGIDKNQIKTVATEITNEIATLSTEQLQKIQLDSLIPLESRRAELEGFQRMMDFIRTNKINDAGVIRAQVITQNYICFVYLKDSYFRTFQNLMPSITITHRCCKFLTSARIRKFRNSIAHGNWNYKTDFGGLEYWDYQENKKDKGYEYFEVLQDELNFWQTLSRGVAYSSILSVLKRLEKQITH